MNIPILFLIVVGLLVCAWIINLVLDAIDWRLR